MFQIGLLYHGFRLIKKEKIAEINSLMLEFKHEKSGARLIHLQNDEENKVFSITFKTPPKDNSGAAHVLEHCVLRGSRKYSINNPCVELMKGAISTFFNAFTFKDKTVYIGASMNHKDLDNIIDFYMDGVLNPNLYNSPEILMQEGWHYELSSKDGTIEYNGIVLNEMRSVFSSPESILARNAHKSLFPTTSYRFEAGGIPESILDLNQEKLERFHKEYYHPSNSYIYLYGKMDLVEKLKFLNEEYLSKYTYKQIASSIIPENQFDKAVQVIEDYSISQNEKEANKTYLSLNFVIGKSTDSELYLAFEILKYILLDSPAALLKQILVKADFKENIYGVLQKNMLQPVFSIVAKNSEVSRKDEFKKIIFKALREIVHIGIDKRIIRAALNLKEFTVREMNDLKFPTGFNYNLKILDSWLYDGDAAKHLYYKNNLNSIKTSLTNDYFEKLIEKYLVNNLHYSMFVLQPKKGLNLLKSENEKKLLGNLKENLSENSLDKIIRDTVKLKEIQITASTEKKEYAIPIITIDDIKDDSIDLNTFEEECSGVKVLKHPIFTNGIVYVNLYFSAKAVDQELIPYLPLLCNLLGKLDTKRYKYFNLSNEIVLNTGGVSYSIKPFARNNSDKELSPQFMIQAKVLVNRLPALFDILGDIVNNSIFENDDRLLQIIKHIKAAFEMNINRNPSAIVSQRLTSYFSERGNYMEQLWGISFYEFLRNLEKSFYINAEEIKSKLIKTYDLVFSKVNLTASVTAAPEDYKKFQESFSHFCSSLRNHTVELKNYDFILSRRNEGIKAPNRIQFLSKGYNLKKLEYRYEGGLQVLKTILKYDYLSNMVRIKGGAYGSDINITRLGNIYLSSFMDPNFTNTLKTFNGIPGYLERLDISNKELNNYMVKTYSEINAPLTPFLKGFQADCNYFQRISAEDLKHEQDEIFSVTLEDIRNYKYLLYEIIDQDYFCVLGSQDKIEENGMIFLNTYNIFQ
ncbi:MAG: insulinase family protein [Bacillota bacterium]|nr:insulinase family protein [Bacillota bacterium]